MNKARLFRAARPGDRKKYFRGGVGGGAGAVFSRERTRAEERARRCAAGSKLQGLLGVGVVTFAGPLTEIVYDAQHAPVVTRRLQQLNAQGQVRICGTGTGGVCLGPEWARVLVDGVRIEVLAKAETGCRTELTEGT